MNIARTIKLNEAEEFHLYENNDEKIARISIFYGRTVRVNICLETDISTERLNDIMADIQEDIVMSYNNKIDNIYFEIYSVKFQGEYEVKLAK